MNKYGFREHHARDNFAREDFEMFPLYQEEETGGV